MYTRSFSHLLTRFGQCDTGLFIEKKLRFNPRLNELLTNIAQLFTAMHLLAKRKNFAMLSNAMPAKKNDNKADNKTVGLGQPLEEVAVSDYCSKHRKTHPQSRDKIKSFGYDKRFYFRSSCTFLI